MPWFVEIDHELVELMEQLDMGLDVRAKQSASEQQEHVTIFPGVVGMWLLYICTHTAMVTDLPKLCQQRMSLFFGGVAACGYIRA